MADNSILDENNKPMVANAPNTGTTLDSLKQAFAGLPLGVTASGELGLKVIVIGNASVGIGDLPTADPHQKGKVWNNGGTPQISNG